MPGRRGAGAGGGRRACGSGIRRFLEPCLLLLLHGGESHGYELLDNLGKFGFSETPADSSTIYRILRSLEEQGFVSSRWAEGDSGPAIRVYALSPEGDGYLQTWVRDLQETDRILHRFFNEYQDHMEHHHSGDAGPEESRKE